MFWYDNSWLELQKEVNGCSSKDFSTTARSAGIQFAAVLLLNFLCLMVALGIKLTRTCKAFGCLPWLGILSFVTASLSWFSLLIGEQMSYVVILSSSKLIFPCCSPCLHTADLHAACQSGGVHTVAWAVLYTGVRPLCVSVRHPVRSDTWRLTHTRALLLWLLRANHAGVLYLWRPHWLCIHQHAQPGGWSAQPNGHKCTSQATPGTGIRRRRSRGRSGRRKWGRKSSRSEWPTSRR